MPKPDDDTSAWATQVYICKSGYLKEKLKQKKNIALMSQEFQNVKLCNNDGGPRDYFWLGQTIRPYIYIYLNLVHGLEYLSDSFSLSLASRGQADT